MRFEIDKKEEKVINIQLKKDGKNTYYCSKWKKYNFFQ